VSVPDRVTWLLLAVIDRRGGRQRTNVNLNGLLWTTPRGFEDTGQVSTPSIDVRLRSNLRFRARLLSAAIRERPST
jgi:hypothetical protein